MFFAKRNYLTINVLIYHHRGPDLRDAPLGCGGGRGLERITVPLALEIPENDLVVGDALDVVGIDRDLAAAAGCVDGELGHGVTGGVPPKSADVVSHWPERQKFQLFLLMER